MRTISVSTYSLREELGPISIAFTDGEGAEQLFRQDFPRLLDIEETPARLAERFGVRACETVAFQFSGPDDDAIDRFVGAARHAGLELINIAVDDGDLLSRNPDVRLRDIEVLHRWIERAATAGFRAVRVNPGSPFNPDHGTTPPDHVVTALRELGDAANAAGIRLLVENHGGPSSDPVWMRTLLDAVGRDRLGLLLDLGNFDALLAPLTAALFGSAEPDSDPLDNLDLESVYGGIDDLADRAEIVHVKVHRVDDDGLTGPIDLSRALDILDRHGFDGPLTIEYEGTGGNPWTKVRRIVDAVARPAVAGR